jgi:hypothetical protein
MPTFYGSTQRVQYHAQFREYFDVFIERDQVLYG